MPIEFACESCAKLLRVPDGTSGSQCECPSCGKLLEIPDPNAVGMVEVVEGAATEGQINIPCPKCHFELICSRNLLGTKGQCRNCKYIFLISTNPGEAGTAAESQATSWTFSCPKCEQLFEGAEEMRGRKGKCHSCGEVFQIELKPGNEPETPVLDIPPAGKAEELGAFSAPSIPSISNPVDRKSQPASVPEAQKPETVIPSSSAGQIPAVSDAPALDPAPIQIACSSCQGVMEVPGSTAGQTTACPYCQQLLLIPDASVVPESTSADLGAVAGAEAFPSSTSASNVWEDLGDMSGGALAAGGANPYDAPAPASFGNAWTVPKKKKAISGLTVSNVIDLTMQVAFPASLSAALIYFVLGIVGSILGYGSMFVMGQMLPKSGMDAQNAITIVYVVAGVIGVVLLALGSLGLTMICNGALDTVQNKRPNADALFSPGEAFFPMLVLQFVIMGCGALIGGLPQLALMAVGPNPIIMLMVVGFSAVASVCIGMAFSLAPIAIVDGEGPFEALGISAKIVYNNLPTMIGVFLLTIVCFMAATVLTCGLGAILFCGVPFYVYAAAYHLATK